MKSSILSQVKGLLLSLGLLILSTAPVLAKTVAPSASPSGQIQGVYDTEYSDASSSASPSATPRARTTTLDTSNTPTSGAIENTVLLLVIGTALIVSGLRLSKS